MSTGRSTVIAWTGLTLDEQQEELNDRSISRPVVVGGPTSYRTHATHSLL